MANAERSPLEMRGLYVKFRAIDSLQNLCHHPADPTSEETIKCQQVAQEGA